MTTSAEPTRFRESGGGAPSRLRELFDAAAREQPTAAELARLEAKLAPLLGDTPAPLQSTSTSRLSPALKFGLGMIALGGVGVVGRSRRAIRATTRVYSAAARAHRSAPARARVRPQQTRDHQARPRFRAAGPPSAAVVPLRRLNRLRRRLARRRAQARSRERRPRPGAWAGSSVREKARAALRRDPALALRAPPASTTAFLGRNFDSEGVKSSPSKALGGGSVAAGGGSSGAARRTLRLALSLSPPTNAKLDPPS